MSRSLGAYRVSTRLKWAALVAVAVLVLGVSAGRGALASLGEAATGDRLERMRRSPQWHDDKFVNPEPLWTDERSAMLKSLGPTPPHVRPDSPVDVARPAGDFLATPPASGLRITWFGHSSVLVEVDGISVLTDPIWSERPSPVGWAGPRRFFEPPTALSALPPVDAVLISHDHYDHLDRASVVALATGPTRFVAPLGAGAHLAAWGIAEDRIVELDWWESVTIGAVAITATPARHATGRVIPDADETLWVGYALRGPAHRVYYSGDTGLLPALSEIGQRLGPFDATLIEAGQYDATWPDWHLGPEQAVAAHRMVRGRIMIPIHWALFRLAQHAWTEPAERVLAAAQCQGVSVLIPRPGQSFEPTDTTLHTERWWPALPWQTAGEHPVVATRAGDPRERVAPDQCDHSRR